jgi:transcriptional regulator with XRE-family HTH domain
VGERIRARREELGLSQAALATGGISSPYISLVERGRRNPSAKALRSLAPLLGVSTHWLETGETDPAAELAQLVLANPGSELTPLSRQLARRILET